MTLGHADGPAGDGAPDRYAGPGGHETAPASQTSARGGAHPGPEGSWPAVSGGPAPEGSWPAAAGVTTAANGAWQPAPVPGPRHAGDDQPTAATPTPPYPPAGAPPAGWPVSGTGTGALATPALGTGAFPAVGYQTGGPYPPVSTGGYPGAGWPAPRPAPRRRPVLAILIGVLAVAVAVQGVLLLQLSSRLDRADRRAAAQQSAEASRLADLDARTRALAGSSLDSASVAAAVLPSVFRIDAGNFSGTAFVIASSAGTSSLLTNYHVVAQLFTGGGRTVSLQHDSQRFTARIAKVDKDNDLALLESTEKFPALGAATQQVPTGAPVVVVGAPLGLAQSVTTGVVSAVRSDFPGEGGRTYIQFSAPINPGNSGGPVVDAQKKVVGIASAKATDSEGIGLAIPISVACDSFDVC